MLSVSQILVWIIVGLIGGTLAGSAITWKRSGLGWGPNLLVGLAGAIVGGLLFRLTGILLELDTVSVSLRDIVAAVVGSFVVLLAAWLWQRFGPSHRTDDAMPRSN